MLLFFYFILIFGCKLVILIYFYFVHGEIKLAYLPQRHTKSNPRRFDVDITWICRRANFDKFPCHFHVLFQCNFTDRKIHVAFTYFNRYDITVRKIHVVSTYFFWRNFSGRNIHVVSTKECISMLLLIFRDVFVS